MAPTMSPFGLPAHSERALRDMLSSPQHNTTETGRIVPVLTITESMKVDGRPVLCLEVEAAAEELPPAQPVDAELLRLLDLLLAVAVLLFCLVVGEFSADVRTVGLVLAVGLAGVAVAGLKQHCGEALGTMTPRKRVTKKAASRSEVFSQITESAQYAFERLQLELTGAVLLTVYAPVAAWDFVQDLLQQLPPATAACMPWTIAQRYIACLQAISAIGEEDGRPLFPSQQQYQRQRQQQPLSFSQKLQDTAHYCLERLQLELTAAVILTAYLPVAIWEWVEELAQAAFCEPWQAFQHWVVCLDALSTQLDQDEDDGRPLFTRRQYIYYSREQPQLQYTGPWLAALPTLIERVKLELTAVVILAAYLPVAAWECAAELATQLYSVCQQYVATLQAINRLGEEDGRPLFPAKQQQQQAAVAAAAAAAPAAGSFLHCLQAVGELGQDQDTLTADCTKQQQQQVSKGAVMPAAASLSPVEAVKGFVSCLQAIGQLDSSSDSSEQGPTVESLAAAAAPTPPAAAVAAVPKPASLLNCLKAIGQLDSSEGPSEEHLQVPASKLPAPSAPTGQWMSPMQAAKGFLASLQAIGQLDSSEGPPFEQQGKVAAGVDAATAAAAWAWPVQVVNSYIRTLQAIGEWDSSHVKLD